MLLKSAYIKIKSHPDLSGISSTCLNLCDTPCPATASPTTWLCHNWASGRFPKCSRTRCLHTGQSSLTCRSSPAYLPLSFPPQDLLIRGPSAWRTLTLQRPLLSLSFPLSSWLSPSWPSSNPVCSDINKTHSSPLVLSLCLLPEFLTASLSANT